MQVVDIVLAVVQLGCNLVPSKEGEVTHLKQRLALHVVDIPDGSPDFLFQLHQLGDAGIDLCLQFHDAHHRLLNRGPSARGRNLGFVRDLGRNVGGMAPQPVELAFLGLDALVQVPRL